MARRPKPLEWQLTNHGWYPDCGRCMDYLMTTPWLAEAVASCAIENGSDPAELEKRVVEHYHINGHEERP